MPHQCSSSSFHVNMLLGLSFDYVINQSNPSYCLLFLLFLDVDINVMQCILVLKISLPALCGTFPISLLYKPTTSYHVLSSLHAAILLSLSEEMAASTSHSFCSSLAIVVLAVLLIFTGSSSALSKNHYSKSCPKVFKAVQSVVHSAISKQPRQGASLIRLFFHDCFVNVIPFSHFFFFKMNGKQYIII